MQIKKIHAHAAILASTFSLLAVAQPAWSNQFVDLFKAVLIPSTGAVPPDSIGARENQITNRIIEAINANKLSQADTANLKAQLDSVRAMENTYRSNGSLDSIETASLNSELNKIDANLNRLLGSAPVYVTTANVDSTDQVLADLNRRITKHLGDGSLTIEEAQNLQTKCQRVQADRNLYRADGSLSPGEMSKINAELDDLKSSIDSSIHGGQTWAGIDGQQALQAKRIEDGINQGRLTKNEYNSLRTESDRIANYESMARANGLQLQETIILANDLNTLDRRISTALNNNLTTSSAGNAWDRSASDWNRDPVSGKVFDIQQGNLQRKIDEAAANGSVSAVDAADMRARFKRVEQLEASFRADGRLSPDELNVLQSGLDTITQELADKKTNPMTQQFPELIQRQAEIRHRIDDAQSSGRLSFDDAKRLRGQLDWVENMKGTMSRSSGYLSKAEVDDLMIDLGRVSDKVDRSLVDPSKGLLTRATALRTTLDQNSASGKLSFRAARNCRQELDRITNALQNPRGGTLSPNDATQLAADMDRLNTQITSGLTYGDDNHHGNHYGWGQH